MGANATFSLCAAAASLLVSVLSAINGQPAVAIVFGLLVVGFLFRAGEGRWSGPPSEPKVDEPPVRRVKPARFKRR